MEQSFPCSAATLAQLTQIQFQFGTNSYSAKILNTGEVVSDHLIAPSVTFSTQGLQTLFSDYSGLVVEK